VNCAGNDYACQSQVAKETATERYGAYLQKADESDIGEVKEYYQLLAVYNYSLSMGDTLSAQAIATSLPLAITRMRVVQGNGEADLQWEVFLAGASVAPGVSLAFGASVQDATGKLFGGLPAKGGLATGADEAVFWSGIGRGGDARAATWAAQNGEQLLNQPWLLEV
jgi:hypothetical protein